MERVTGVTSVQMNMCVHQVADKVGDQTWARGPERVQCQKTEVQTADKVTQ